ncbi:hypothetical protein GCM10023091_26540 [Ravibacter arvi]|uniref:Uncharacterized protein n=1 Tax=Ravibacter arvi TaxID=2051041 RepID=A0ABP8M1N3_9BACT
MIRNLIFIAFCLFPGIRGTAQTLAGTDDLGRTLPQSDRVGAPRQNRHVAMFYFLWQDQAPAKSWDLHEIWTKHPEAFEDFDHPAWGGDGKTVGYYYWGQPIYGYYKGDDYWVHLRNMQLLADAAVDLVVIDATNGPTYPQQADALMRAMMAVNQQGKKAPKIVFYTNTASGATMQTVYNQFYKPGAPHYYPETWFLLDGKPLIIGVTAESAGREFEHFFSYRETQWPNEGRHKINGWPWIEFQRPQHVYSNHKGEREIVNVSVAQHPNPTAGMGGSAFYGNQDNWGRSFRNGSKGNPEQDIFYGYNVQEQWDFAVRQEVPFVFVTGWNEWIAGKWPSHDANPEHSWFCDQASPEYSRDIEPTLTAGLRDHYYMQLVDNVRRYKGVAPNPVLSPVKTVRSWKDWDSVFPEYTDYTGDTAPRHHPGAPVDPPTTYVNTTGRNDFHRAKVARDQKNIYFYISTVKPVSKQDGNNWMVLYLDTDRSHRTGWKGFDLRVTGGETLQKFRNGKWTESGKVSCKTEGNQMMITIPRNSLGEPDAPVNLEFKWSDNMQDETEPLDWYLNGDAAPGGRFNFIACEK